MNAFHVLGGLLALWALMVSFLGITRENFPATRVSERIVATISIVLVVLAIVSAPLSAAGEDEQESEQEPAAMVLGSR